MLEPSRLNRRILLMRRKKTVNEVNETIDSWVNISFVYANISPASAREFFRSERLLNSQTSKFLIHYRSDFNSEDRIFYDNLNWNILNIAEVGYQEGLEILAEVISNENSVKNF